MSIHPSLRIKPYGKKKRSVLKRGERIKKLEAEGKWKEGDSVYRLPKQKIVRFKIAKDKKVKKEVLDEVAPYEPPKHKKESRDIGKIK